MNDTTPHAAAVPRHPDEQQRAFVLARLRRCGPAFAHELIAEGMTPNPAARVAELNADGHHIEALRSFPRLPDGSDGWAVLYVLQVKCAKTGAVIAAPVPLGAGPVLERWNP